MSGFSDMGYNYDTRSTPMTTAAICATREVSWNPSLYRGEQFDSDLGLYYLRHRYYNPLTGRFMSRDPKDGEAKVPASLHKYLYANGDPVNGIDPRGTEDEVEYIDLNAETKLETFLIDNTLCGILGLAVSELTKPFDALGGLGAGFVCSALQTL